MSTPKEQRPAMGQDIGQTIRNATEAIKGLVRENAELRARLSELHDWMRSHTGVADGTHDMLCRSHYALKRPNHTEAQS